MAAARIDMAVLELPTQRELLFSVLERLRTSRGRLGTRELNDQLADHFSLSREARELERATGGCTILYQRLSWALTRLKALNMVEQPARGQWMLTTLGRRISKTELYELALRDRRSRS
jgi:restriction endonuclease Mrr